MSFRMDARRKDLSPGSKARIMRRHGRPRSDYSRNRGPMSPNIQPRCGIVRPVDERASRVDVSECRMQSDSSICNSDTNTCATLRVMPLDASDAMPPAQVMRRGQGANRP